jgi:hypothetical protein
MEAAATAHDHDHGNMTLRSTHSTRAGLAAAQTVDARVCSCCGTDLQRDAGGRLWALFRDRSDEEVRDTALAQWQGGRWQHRGLAHADGWHIEACPVNGPALAITPGGPIAAWSTMPDGQTMQVKARVLDADAAPLTLDAGSAVRGRVDAAPLGEGALVVWLSGNGSGGSWLQATTLGADSRAAASRTVAQWPAGRDVGFPRVASNGEVALLVWAEAVDGAPRVQARWLR